MRELNLFIDESGSSNPRVASSPCYIVCGCVVNNDARPQLKIKADQIKFKYWNRTDIVFHSVDIGRKQGDFRILQDPAIYKSFRTDLSTFLHDGNYNLFFTVVDRAKALALNWDENKVLKETSDTIVRYFILALLADKKSKGRIVVESATSKKDFLYHKSAALYLAHGLNRPITNYMEVQDVLTEVSFVTKRNHDIEEQIADLMAYGARLKFQNKPSNTLTDYERGLLNTMEYKLFKVNPTTGPDKKRYLSEISGFNVIPNLPL